MKRLTSHPAKHASQNCRSDPAKRGRQLTATNL